MKVMIDLHTIIAKVAKEIFAEFSAKKLQQNELAISLVDLTGGLSPAPTKLARSVSSVGAADMPPGFSIANFRGEEPIFPASVVKLFYLVAIHQWLEDKKIPESDELNRACKDMIVDSSNDATHYIVDVLTDTTGGTELPPAEMGKWSQKRNVVNEYFKSLGYQNINIVQKTWNDGPFGRDHVFYGKDFANRNRLTTNATARLFAEIATGQFINRERSKKMLDLLARDFTKASTDPDDQATGFFGSALPAGAKLWSKAGWMSTARHDAAYIELPTGIRFVLVAFISNHAKEHGILPAIAKRIVASFERIHTNP